jgi:D-aminopeptidase
LIEADRVAEHVLSELGEVRPEDFEIPEDIVAALQANSDAWANWLAFAPAYRRIRAAYVDWARDRGEEFEKRLRTLVELTARGNSAVGMAFSRGDP